MNVPLNGPQRLFLDQANSDYGIYLHCKQKSVCHRLHYLQMCTEKLSKVWFWRLLSTPGRGHWTFEPFLRGLETSGRTDFHEMFGYSNAKRFQLLKPKIFDIARRIQDLAPGLNNANPEYPWPRNFPIAGPLKHSFAEWHDWSSTVAGRRLHDFVKNVLANYTSYFPEVSTPSLLPVERTP